MDIKEVKSIPSNNGCARTSSRERVALFEKFINSGARYAQITDPSITSKENAINLASSLVTSIKHYGYRVKVHRRGMDLYLERMD